MGVTILSSLDVDVRPCQRIRPVPLFARVQDSLGPSGSVGLKLSESGGKGIHFCVSVFGFLNKLTDCGTKIHAIMS